MDAKKVPESQLMRDRSKKEKKFSEMEKTRLLLEGMRSDYSISEYFVEKGINTDVLFKWKREILEADNAEFRVLRNGEAKREIERLEIENIYLRQLVNNLKAENDKLRRS